jgi:hypothetical protein
MTEEYNGIIFTHPDGALVKAVKETVELYDQLSLYDITRTREMFKKHNGDVKEVLSALMIAVAKGEEPQLGFKVLSEEHLDKTFEQRILTFHRYFDSDKNVIDIASFRIQQAKKQLARKNKVKKIQSANKKQSH